MSDLDTEPSYFSYDELQARFSEYQTIALAYGRALFINEVHLTNPGGLDEVSFAEWTQNFPPVEAVQVDTLHEQLKIRRIQVAQSLGLAVELIDDLAIAMYQETVYRESDPKPWWPGLVVGPGEDRHSLYNGLVTMARLTGMTFKLHAGDVETDYYEITPKTSYVKNTEK